jgi:hypothetical protein
MFSLIVGMGFHPVRVRTTFLHSKYLKVRHALGHSNGGIIILDDWLDGCCDSTGLCKYRKGSSCIFHPVIGCPNSGSDWDY